MRRTKERLHNLDKGLQLFYGAVYVTSESVESVDVYARKMEFPRVFEWNLFHHPRQMLETWLDMDGVLCRDPTPEENDDGDRYLDFIRNARPLFLPSVPVRGVVTSRLEKYRAATEGWLQRHKVKFGEARHVATPNEGSQAPGEGLRRAQGERLPGRRDALHRVAPEERERDPTPHAEAGLLYGHGGTLRVKKLIVYKARIREESDQDYDVLLPVQEEESVEFVMFSNNVQEETWIDGWRVLPPVFKEENHRRTARRHKCLPHVLFPEADFTLWLDGVFTLRHPAKRIFQEYGGDDLVTHRHPTRSCAYQEARSQKRKKKDRPELFDANVARMRGAGFPENYGLAETGAVLRANTNENVELGERWWNEIASGCVRDQVSFDFIRWQLKIPAVYFRGIGKRSPHFEWRPHHPKT